MKLYFKDLSYETKYKYLDFIHKVACISEYGYNYEFDFKLGYVLLSTNIDNTRLKEIKSLDIWRESPKFGKFWDRNPELYYLGWLSNESCGNCSKPYIMVTKEGEFLGQWENFVEITDVNKFVEGIE